MGRTDRIRLGDEDDDSGRSTMILYISPKPDLLTCARGARPASVFFWDNYIKVEPIFSINLLRLQLRSQRIDLSQSEEDTEYRLDRSFLIKSSV
ncbi:hypothetical protein V6N13_145428 [Hibiscus sabdariffa]|uniref:Uncharacterized protein n=1 Tax=Hibiscus sabdariffa TaxID=183260 RepID=A0ABR2TPJ9_9ROSI